MKKKITGLRRSKKTKNKDKITKSMAIGEVIRKYPRAAFVFIDYNLHCVGCPMAAPETVEEAAKLHHLNVDEFIKDLNKVADKAVKKHKPRQRTK